MRILVPLVLLALVGCEPVRSSMIEYRALRSDRQARFFVEDHMVALETHDPMGLVLVAHDPSLDGEGRVILGAGIASAGSEQVRVHCFELAPLSPAEGWEERLSWREPGGALARITELERGPEARARVAQCRARR